MWAEKKEPLFAHAQSFRNAASRWSYGAWSCVKREYTWAALTSGQLKVIPLFRHSVFCVLIAETISVHVQYTHCSIRVGREPAMGTRLSCVSKLELLIFMQVPDKMPAHAVWQRLRSPNCCTGAPCRNYLYTCSGQYIQILLCGQQLNTLKLSACLHV